MTPESTLETWTSAMKRFLLPALLAALTLFGCQKGTEVIGGNLVFSSDAPVTRTGWTGETIEWTAGDAISMAYTVDRKWVGPNIYPSTPLTTGGPTAQFTVPGDFNSSMTGAHHFYAVYPAVSYTDFSDAPDVFASIPEIQTPTATSYDPAADLMAGESEDWRSLPETPVPLRWKRLTAHADITLKNLALAEGETVKSIVLQGQHGAELTGDVIIDLANPEEFATVGVPRVTVLADNLSVDASGNLECWVSIFPVTLTELTVAVTTDRATYRKTFSGISKTFTQNARNILGISMAGAEKTTPDSGPDPYVKVNTAPADWTGDYLIVYEPETILLDGDGSKTTHATVEILDGKIDYETYKAYNVRIEADGTAFTMQFGDSYLGLNGNSNTLNFNTSVSGDGYRWTFTVADGNTLAYNVAYPSRVLQYNTSAHMFRCYTGSQQPVQFYKLNGEDTGGTEPLPVTPTVTTGEVQDLSRTDATLTATYTGSPTYGGFEWGLSPDVLDQDTQAHYLGGGSFSTLVSGLGAGHTYYYRAYIAVLEEGSYRFYYGETRSFTTPESEIVIGGDQPGWYETPAMNITHDGDYMFNTSDPSQYYAIHMCAGGEKGPDGKTARNYTVCFSAEHHCPVWVAAPRHSMYVGSSGRTDAYRQDPDVPADIQYNSTNTGGGCNKGHMLGSAERTSSKATNRDVFYYTNIAPQLSSGFNTGGGRWNVLEDFVDNQVCADTLYEVLGCYFEKYTDAYGETQDPTTISFGGRDDVSMPTMFYYVLLRTKKGNSGKALKDCTADELMCVAFVRAHVNVRQAVSSRELMSVADLEKITGVTYFPNVPHAPKTSFKASDWGL